MFIEAGQLMNLPVAAQDTLSKIGEVAEILVEPESGALLGFLVQTGILAKKALAAMDVIEYDPKGIVTATADNLVDPSEIIRLDEVLKKKIFLFGMKAKTESGQNLGVVEDFLIDTEAQTVAKYYLKDLLQNKRVLSADKVVSIDKQIIFADDVAGGTPVNMGTQTA